MALDLCTQLTLLLDETEVLQQILSIFQILFAPQRIVFHVITDGAVTTTLVFPSSREVPPPYDPRSATSTTTRSGFRLRIPYKEETIGLIEVEGLSFPEQRERYLSLAFAIAGVLGLSISNARTHHRLEVALSDLQQENATTRRLSGELKAANEELEERVRQRTAELEKTARDLEAEVNQRRAAEETVRARLAEKTILLRELHHRVKNNLQIITSLLSLQARKIDDPPFHLALMESQNRIRIISSVHEMLLTSQDLAHIDLHAVVPRLAANLLVLYGVKPGTIALRLDIPAVSVDINTAIPLSLILNELAANSIKHAFPGGRTGEIAIAIQDCGQALVITCGDDGVGMPSFCDWENADSVGFTLINGLTGQLNGTIEKGSGPGTWFTITMPSAPADTGSVRGTYNEIPMR